MNKKFRDRVKDLLEKVGDTATLDEIANEVEAIAEECLVTTYTCDSCNDQNALDNMYTERDQEVEEILE